MANRTGSNKAELPPYTDDQSEEENAPVDSMASSMDVMFGDSKLIWWMLSLGPIAVLGDASGVLGESMCFICAGIAMIPCAERLSFATEQVARHTNGTIGALLNATFGNTPELLISMSALRADLVQVVQLSLLGSILTNMLLVFGISSIIGGLRYQVQVVRPVTGSVHAGMLWLGTGAVLVTLLVRVSSGNDGRVATSILDLSRMEAIIMLFCYVLYLFFQLVTHKEEFDLEIDVSRKTIPRRNMVCKEILSRIPRLWSRKDTFSRTSMPTRTLKSRNSDRKVTRVGNPDEEEKASLLYTESDSIALDSSGYSFDEEDLPGPQLSPTTQRRRRRLPDTHIISLPELKIRQSDPAATELFDATVGTKFSFDGLGETSIVINDDDASHVHIHTAEPTLPQLSLRIGIVWLLIITLCISAMSDILVDSIDSFASRMHLSPRFVSMVVIPFFSNVAEQVSSFLFAYRNEMDLVVGVTIGSAIQIATLVLPGTVLMGGLLDSPMTLDFGSFETSALVIGVLSITAILQGGTTNWFAGAILVGIYAMIALGLWYLPEPESLNSAVEGLNNTQIHNP